MQKKNDAILEQVIFRLIELSLREITYLRFEGVTPAQLPQPRRKTYLYDFHIRVGGHRLRYSAMICPDISIHRLNERIRNFETLKKSKHPLILTPELSKPQQHNFIGRGISFIDCLGNVFLVYDKPQIYFQNAFKARGNSANFHVFRSTLFSDRASVIARSLFQAPDESLSDSSETESSATAKAALAIWKKEMADSYGLFRDEASLLLRAFFNKDKELSQAELSRMTGLSKAEVSRIIRIISQKYFLSANPKNRRLYRILSAHKLLRDWIDYYRQVKVDFREYWVDKDSFYKRLSEFNAGGSKLYASFRIDEPFIDPIHHFVMKPGINFELVELYFDLHQPGLSNRIIISEPAYRNSFSYGAYPVSIPERNYKAYSLSRVQCLLDLARLIPDSPEKINQMVKDIAQGLEWKLYPPHGSIK